MLTPVYMSATKKNLSIPANLDHSAEVRDTVKQFFTQAGFDRVWANRLVLVADELFMNAVKYGCRDGDMITINLDQDADTVRFAITDTGACGITPAELKDKIEHHGATHTPQKTSGRGLAIITEAWTDGYSVDPAENGGLTISFVKKLPTIPVGGTETPASANATTSDSFEIKLTGEIDESNLVEKTKIIEEFLTGENHSRLALDMAGVTFINSSMIGKLASWHNTLASRDGALKILNATPEVNDILTLTGLDKVLTITIK